MAEAAEAARARTTTCSSILVEAAGERGSTRAHAPQLLIISALGGKGEQMSEAEGGWERGARLSHLLPRSFLERHALLAVRGRGCGGEREGTRQQRRACMAGV